MHLVEWVKCIGRTTWGVRSMSQAVNEHRAAALQSLNLAVVTVSDSRTLETDTFGALIVALAEEAGHRIVERVIVRDEPAEMTPLFQTF